MKLGLPVTHQTIKQFCSAYTFHTTVQVSPNYRQ